MSLEDDDEGRSGEKSSTTGTGIASPETSGAGEGETVTEHPSLEDFQTLLELLKGKLPEKVLQDVICTSRQLSESQMSLHKL